MQIVHLMTVVIRDRGPSVATLERYGFSMAMNNTPRLMTSQENFLPQLACRHRGEVIGNRASAISCCGPEYLNVYQCNNPESTASQCVLDTYHEGRHVEAVCRLCLQRKE